MQETWIRWDPIRDLAAKYEVESMDMGLGPFIISLVDVNNKHNQVQVTFPMGIECYRTTAMEMSAGLLEKLARQHGPLFTQTWSFFKVLNSEYCQELSDGHYGITKPTDLTHYAIITPSTIIDLPAPSGPTVEIITLQ